MEITLLGYDYYRYGWYDSDPPFHVALTPELHASLVYYHNDVVQERLRKLSALVKYHKRPAFFAEYLSFAPHGGAITGQYTGRHRQGCVSPVLLLFLRTFCLVPMTIYRKLLVDGRK
jgi:hypothetical protein